MKLDFLVEGFVRPPHPQGITLEGDSVRLEPLDVGLHAQDLFAAHALDTQGENWTYLPYGPFADFAAYESWLYSIAGQPDPFFFAIISAQPQSATVSAQQGSAIGVASYLRINQDDASIEVGHIHYSPLLQRTKAGTETMYLMMRWAFESGYRRYEWKCSTLNRRSRAAAQRLGFSYEGVFRQMSVQKGRNRNTAWFAVIDTEWPALEACFTRYLDQDNFEASGSGGAAKPKLSLAALTKPLLYKYDDLEFG